MRSWVTDARWYNEVRLRGEVFKDVGKLASCTGNGSTQHGRKPAGTLHYITTVDSELGKNGCLYIIIHWSCSKSTTSKHLIPMQVLSPIENGRDPIPKKNVSFQHFNILFSFIFIHLKFSSLHILILAYFHLMFIFITFCHLLIFLHLLFLLCEALRSSPSS